MFTDLFRENGIQDKTLSLLYKWVEIRSSSVIKPPFHPQEVQKFVFRNFINRKGQACYSISVLEGLDFIRSTKPKEFTDANEVAFAFYDLTENDQLIIISWVDPYTEFNTDKEWKEFLIEYGITKNHQNLLVDAMLEFQDNLRKRGLVRMSESDVLKGWKSIAGYLSVSIPSAIQLAKDANLPVGMLKGRVVTTKKRLDVWLDSQIESNPYSRK